MEINGRHVFYILLIAISIPVHLIIFNYGITFDVNYIKNGLQAFFEVLTEEAPDGEESADHEEEVDNELGIPANKTDISEHYENVEEENDQVRPNHLLYRVGQTVLYTPQKFIGVITGWKANAEDIEEEPTYEVLIYQKGEPRIINSVQSNLLLLEGIAIPQSGLELYFDDYDGKQYVPTDWLRKKYPADYVGNENKKKKSESEL